MNFFYCFIFTLIVYLPGCTVHPSCIRAFLSAMFYIKLFVSPFLCEYSQLSVRSLRSLQAVFDSFLTGGHPQNFCVGKGTSKFMFRQTIKDGICFMISVPSFSKLREIYLRTATSHTLSN